MPFSMPPLAASISMSIVVRGFMMSIRCGPSHSACADAEWRGYHWMLKVAPPVLKVAVPCLQARQLPEDQVDLKVHTVDSHRLAYYLDTQNNSLVSLVLSALKEFRSSSS